MIIGPKVLAVDDNPDHLNALARGFDALGGLCVTLDYEKAALRGEPFPSGIRLLFMDINLMPGAGDNQDARNFSPILQVIKRVVSPQNGPYALVTWTDRPEAHGRLVEFLETNLPNEFKPCAEFCLSKGTFLENMPALQQRLATLKQELPGLAMLFDWERAIYDAADRSVFGIMSLSSLHGRAGGSAVVGAVRAIAEAASGAGAEDEPFRAFASGMSAVLIDRIEHASPEADIEKEWGRIFKRFPAEALSGQQIASLNKFLHVAPASDASRGPGIVYQVPVAQILQYLQPTYRSGRAALISGEFVPLQEGTKRPTNPQSVANQKTFAAACRWRFIQLGAACDHVNRKSKVIEGILAVEVPDSVFAQTHLVERSRAFRDNPAKSDWLFQTPPFAIDKGHCSLVINLRYRLAFPLNGVKQLKPLYRLREALTEEISDQSANFSTRPGLVEFRTQSLG